MELVRIIGKFYEADSLCRSFICCLQHGISLPVVIDRRVYFHDLIDVVQDQCGTMRCGGADHDVAAAEELLDQGLCVTYALNLVPAEGVVEADQYPAFAGYASDTDRVKLILPKQDDVEDSDGDRQRNQDRSEINDRQIQFVVIAEKAENSTEQQSSKADAYRGSNAEPDDVPDCFGDKEETVAFDAVEDFFIFVVHLSFLSEFCPSLPAGTKLPSEKTGGDKTARSRIHCEPLQFEQTFTVPAR